MKEMRITLKDKFHKDYLQEIAEERGCSITKALEYLLDKTFYETKVAPLNKPQ